MPAVPAVCAPERQQGEKRVLEDFEAMQDLRRGGGGAQDPRSRNLQVAC